MSARTMSAANALSLALALLVAPDTARAGQARTPQGVTCSLPSLLDDLRSALQHGSPALRRYAARVLREAALSMSAHELRAAFDSERDPAVLEALAGALAGRYSHAHDTRLLDAVLARAQGEPDPLLRAAAIRGLRDTGSVEAMSGSKRTSYDQLIRDPSPEVRAAVVANLVDESAHVYSGHSAAVSAMAVAAAAASPDKAAGARLLREVSMEQAGPTEVRTLEAGLRDDSPGYRAAAAAALGGVPAGSAVESRSALVDRYRAESSPEVRKAILEGLARLGLLQALPTLDSLRAIDPAMVPEIDAWTQALGLRLQEWSLTLREKRRLRP